MRITVVVTATLLAIVTAAAGAQAPWKVTLTPTVNPLWIGSCGAVWLVVVDPKTKDAPRTPAGHRVTIADFDMQVASPDGKSVIGKYSGPGEWGVCACQSGTVGAQAAVTATYPAKLLATTSRVPGVAFEVKAPFTVSKAMGGYDPPGCAGMTSAPRTPSQVGIPVAPPASRLPASPIPAAPVSLPAQTPIVVATPTTKTVPAPAAPPTSVPVLIPAPIATATPAPTSAPTSSTAKRTSFDPIKHGFRFRNDFTNNFLGPPISIETSGLCGGMTYTVLDYFNSGRTIPSQTYRPANGTTIQMYLYGRQVTSLVTNLDKWAETSVNPFGSRTTEFFNWGLSGRLQELKSYIDRGVPVTLGLKGGEGTLSHDHQVLAIGYDAGRYKGDLGAYKEDLKIFIFDPNFPTETMTLIPNPGANEYHYLEHAERWRTYFVDGKYSPNLPPVISNPNYPSDGLSHELLFEFGTGPDDMRGGADHVDVTIHLSNNTTQYYSNISQNGRWLPFYSETARVVLTQPILPGTIASIEISTNATGGTGGDNWDMFTVQVTAIGGNVSRTLLTNQAGPYRFTGARIPFVFQVK